MSKLPKNLEPSIVYHAYLKNHRNQRATARELGVDAATVKRHVDKFEQPAYAKHDKGAETAALRAEVKNLQKQALTDEIVRNSILEISAAPIVTPKWTEKHVLRKVTDLAGVPTLFASDWHWGEVVRPSEIGGVNEFNLTIAHKRAATMLEATTQLLTKHLASARYPGICLALGGDMLSGDIHEELTETNEIPMMPAMLDLMGVLINVIDGLQETFGNVFCVGVTGNHSRTTRKPRQKRRNHTNFDWLLYQLLAKHYQNNKRISFQIPDGPDASYKLYGHRYLLTHGDQFRGGDGIIGALGPIIRGDMRKRSRQAQVNAAYDTMLLGHWHQLIMLDRVIVNGSLKGYDEYAAANNFSYESPRQGLWITHPEMGITFSMPVYADRGKAPESHGWASVPKVTT